MEIQSGVKEVKDDVDLLIEKLHRVLREHAAPQQGPPVSVPGSQPGPYHAQPGPYHAPYPLGATSSLVQYFVSQQAAPQMRDQVLQSVPVKAADGAGEAGRPSGLTEPRAREDGHTTSYAGVGVTLGEPGNGAQGSACAQAKILKSEGGAAARVERLTTLPHVEHLVQHVKGELEVPGAGGGRREAVNVLFDTGSGVTSISEELVVKLASASPGYHW